MSVAVAQRVPCVTASGLWKTICTSMAVVICARLVPARSAMRYRPKRNDLRPNPAVNTDAPRRGFARLSRAGYLTRWAS